MMASPCFTISWVSFPESQHGLQMRPLLLRRKGEPLRAEGEVIRFAADLLQIGKQRLRILRAGRFDLKFHLYTFFLRLELSSTYRPISTAMLPQRTRYITGCSTLFPKK